MRLSRRSLLYALASAPLIAGPRAQSGMPSILTFATDEIFPLAYADNGEKKGFLIDVVSEIFRRAEIEISFSFLPWARCLVEARLGQISGLFAAFHTPERAVFLDYGTEVLMMQRQNLFVTVDSPIQNAADLKQFVDLRIGLLNQVSQGDAIDHKIQTGFFHNIEVTNTAENVLRMLVAGRIDMAILHRAEGSGMAKVVGLDSKIRALDPPLSEIPAYLAFTKAEDMRVPLAKSDAALRGMYADGTYDRIHTTYFGMTLTQR